MTDLMGKMLLRRGWVGFVVIMTGFQLLGFGGLIILQTHGLDNVLILFPKTSFLVCILCIPYILWSVSNLSLRQTEMINCFKQ